MKRNVSIALATLLLVAAAALAAGKREGKITRIDQSAQVLSVQGEKGDQWDVYLTETTKFEHGLTLAELKIGDQIEFEYVERDGKVWATEIEREKKAD
jgi:Cu/Ag efflux protein CusF